MLKEGEPAVDFTLPADDGTKITLSSLKGSPVVVYFYPKDNTSGCTREALDFTGLLPEFRQLQTKIIGISPDSTAKHANFKKKHGLKITLLADEEKLVAQQYGVWAEKKMYGRTYMGIVRSTFLIDERMSIVKTWPKVRVKDHAQDVLAAVRDLAKS